MSALHNIWSLAALPGGDITTSPATTAPAPSLDYMLLNDILFTRLHLHHIPKLILLVPPSETRLLNEGLIPMYASVRSFLDVTKEIARKRGITVPPLSDIPEDYREEAASDSKLLKEQLSPYMVVQTKNYAEALEASETDGKQHWTSCVAPFSVSVSVYIESLTATKGLVKESGTKVPATYMEAILVDESLAQYSELIASEEMLQPVRVLGEELLRIRSEGSETGWREEEAKANTVARLALIADSFKG